MCGTLEERSWLDIAMPFIPRCVTLMGVDSAIPGGLSGTMPRGEKLMNNLMCGRIIVDVNA